MPMALITGGGSFFSRETSIQLLEQGWDIALTDVNEKLLAEVVETLGGAPRVTGSKLDVTDRVAVKDFVERLVVEHGSVDALVNVAGGANAPGFKRLPFHETDPGTWDLILRPNLYGVMTMCHVVLPHMIKARKGSVVSTSSSQGLRGKKLSSLYSTAKRAIIRFTQAVCQEVGEYGVRMNCVAPGKAESRWTPDILSGGADVPLGSRASARDVADAIVFLLSERASHITGACIDVSGGASLH
jgi:2-hydroxycyclohexanecarboxyl-CoA dehydrogenase